MDKPNVNHNAHSTILSNAITQQSASQRHRTRLLRRRGQPLFKLDFGPLPLRQFAQLPLLFGLRLKRPFRPIGAQFLHQPRLVVFLQLVLDVVRLLARRQLLVGLLLLVLPLQTDRVLLAFAFQPLFDVLFAMGAPELLLALPFALVALRQFGSTLFGVLFGLAGRPNDMK